MYQALVRTINDPQNIQFHYRRAYAQALDKPLNLSKGPDFVWQEALDNLARARRLWILLERLAEQKSTAAALGPAIDAVRNAKP